MGFVLAIVIGVVLGLIGGGGSILAVPVLVYVMGVNPIQATAYSLFIIGSSALVGARNHYKLGNIDFQIGTFFAIPSFLGVFVSRRWLLPAIPDNLYETTSFVLTKDGFLMLLFAVIMFLASFSMLFKQEQSQQLKEIKKIKIIADGLIVGVITGLVGAGGGFLIVPALVFLSGLEIKKAIGTSLMIIAVKSLFGFLAEWGSEIDWQLLLLFTALSTSGIFLGGFLGKFMDGKKIKKSFGFFILFMAIAIIIKETVWI